VAGVVLEGVSRVYPNGVSAVQQVDFEVRDRELLVLVGPSGCGKTTTLRLIAGLEDVTSGEIRIGGRLVNHVPPNDRDIAMVFQNYALYPHMSVYKNMAFGLELRYGGSWRGRAWRRLTDPSRAAEMTARRRQIGERVGQAARTLGIEGLLDRMPRHLSGGERQRVALGRAIVRQPAAFLFDEPLSNLDAKLRVEMRRELKHLHRRLETTMIYVTHDQVEALTMGDRIAVMAEGRLQQVGQPLEVYDRPQNRFVAGFIGTPSMNFLRGGVTRNNIEEWTFTGSGWSVPLPQPLLQVLRQRQPGPLLLGIRPEDVQLGTEAPHVTAGRLTAEVSLVESTGDASIVQFAGLAQDGAPAGIAVEDSAVLCKLDARTRLNPGDRVPIVFNMGRAHVFDALTGANVALAGNVKGN